MAKRYGVMIDCSRNGVMKPSQVKEFIGVLANMGYNTFMLYTEDTYEITGEPYFGYRRGRYTKKELKEIDDFCLSVGVELIPCIQTLSHLATIFRNGVYAGVRDRGAVLLADEEKTYGLIERMLVSVKECFSSDVVHIGMDEAEEMGLGAHLKKFGYEKAADIFTRHLKRVYGLCEKHGLQPIIWSDMLFKIIGKNYFFEEGDPLYEYPDEVKKSLPKELGYVYWYYYIGRRESYENMFTVHEELARGKKENVWFAGGCWSWAGTVPKNGYSLKTMTLAMDVCRDKEIDNIILTLWGDGGKECSYFAFLPSLFYLIERAKGNFDEASVKDKFKRITGEDYDEFSAIDMIGEGDYCGEENASYYMFYDDPFMGIYAHTAPEKNDFSAYASRLEKYSKKTAYTELFSCMAAYADFMSVKYTLGKKTRKAYKNKDAAELSALIGEYGLAIQKLDVFIEKYQTLWYKENKATGFEVQEIRLGGLSLRLKHCQKRLEEYLQTGKSIEEIEERELDIRGGGSTLKRQECLTSWRNIVTANNI